MLRIVQIDDGRMSNVEVSAGRSDFNGVYECMAVNDAGSDNDSVRIEHIPGWS